MLRTILSVLSTFALFLYSSTSSDACVSRRPARITEDYSSLRSTGEAIPVLQCPVCIQALQLDLLKPSNNAAEFALTSVKSCNDATKIDDQKVVCVQTFLMNAQKLVKEQMKGVTPLQSCKNLGLKDCVSPPAPPTAPPIAPTPPPTNPPTPTPPLPPVLA